MSFLYHSSDGEVMVVLITENKNKITDMPSDTGVWESFGRVVSEVNQGINLIVWKKGTW